MRAATYAEYGDPSVLTVTEVPEPHAGPGRIRIKVAAASVNPIDVKGRLGPAGGGEPLAEPAIPGVDASGVVDEVGEGVEGVSVGDDVFGLGSATNAEYAVLRAWTAKPPAVDWAAAAGAGLVSETAERGLRMLGVKQGDVVFVDGGAGGVGSTAVQFAVAASATVIASASQDNHDYLREIGATPVLYGHGLVGRVRAVHGVDHIDAVFDTAGKTPVEDLVALAGDPARVLTIANFSAGDSGIILTTGGGDESRPEAALSLAAKLLVDSRLVLKFQTFPLDRVAEAHRLSESGHTRGKLVLLP